MANSGTEAELSSTGLPEPEAVRVSTTTTRSARVQHLHPAGFDQLRQNISSDSVSDDAMSSGSGHQETFGCSSVSSFSRRASSSHA